MNRLILAVALILTLARPTWADWQAGQAAADQGDFETAAAEWSIAADNGDTKSQFSLGFLYQMGDGVARDFAQAFQYYHMAAEAGHAGAQIALGNLCRMGLGMDADKVTAYMWFALAASAGHIMGARSLERLSGKMTGEEIKQAQILEQDWYQQHP